MPKKAQVSEIKTEGTDNEPVWQIFACSSGFRQVFKEFIHRMTHVDRR